MKPRARPGAPCPCGARRVYGDCCGRLHAGEPAPGAEALMRSRYTAYVFGLEDYLLATWSPATRPASLSLADSPTRWLGLKIIRSETTGPDTAIVEFEARFKARGRTGAMRETSRFALDNGRWLYVDGEIAEPS